MTTVTKRNSSLEESIITSDKKTKSTFYPSRSTAVYSVKQRKDNYGRLGTITDVMKNSFDLHPTYSENNYVTSGQNGKDAKLAAMDDYTNGNKTKYAYENGVIARVGTFNSSGAKLNEELYDYDRLNRLKSDAFKYGEQFEDEIKSSVEYVSAENSPTADNRVLEYSYKLKGEEKAKTQNAYDAYKRLNEKTITINNYAYNKALTYDKTRIKRIVDKKNNSVIHDTNYTYDCLGRISNQTDSADSTINNGYIYDGFGRLVRENNKALDKTYIYEYNGIGNVTSVKAYPYTTSEMVTGTAITTSFTYGDTNNPDRLTKFNGEDITYDLNGCPVRYGDKVLVWDKGKLIKVYEDIDENSSDSSETIEFKHNAYGQRVYKRYDYDPGPDYSGDFLVSSTTTYTYDAAGRLLYETCVENYTESASKTYVTTYLYDQSTVIGFTLTENGTDAGTYYYHRNLLGDVAEVYNENGNKVVKYAYDAWGNRTTVQGAYSLAEQFNNITYRGYYYDKETGLYCCGARYYVPKFCRWLSPDSTEYLDPTTVSGLNLYAYCGNDPVNYCDPSGHMAVSTLILLICIGVGAVVGGTYAGVTAYNDGARGWKLVGWTALGAVEGGIIGGLVGYAVGPFAAGLFGSGGGLALAEGVAFSVLPYPACYPAVL